MTNSVNLDQLEERPVLVVDYGAQYAQLIARRVREAGIYSEIVPHSMSTEKMLAKNPAAIVLSGGPSSVYADGAPKGDKALFEAGVPIFGICYGFQVMAQTLGGTVARPVCANTAQPTLWSALRTPPSSPAPPPPRTCGCLTVTP